MIYLTSNQYMEEDLIKIGLSDKQAKVYLALLSLGKSSVQAISEQAGVKRATTYVILDELMSMGLVSTYEQLKKTFFVPESPERLAVLAQSQSAEIDRQITELKSIAPQLNKMRQKVGDGAKVEFFEGKESLKKAIKQVLQAQAHSTVRMFYNNDKISQHFSDTEREQIRDARQKKKIKTKIIYTSTSR